MRTLDEIRTEMADCAYYAKISKEAGVQSAVDRHEAAYGALAWVLEEPWKVTGEFEKSDDRKLLESFHARLREATRPNRRVDEMVRLVEEIMYDMTMKMKEMNDG